MATNTGAPPRPQHQQRRRDGRGPRPPVRDAGAGPELLERVVQINHVAKVVKGGRRFGFSTVVVVGDGKGKVGVSIGKAKEVPESITKGRSSATKSMAVIKILRGTLPHQIVGRCGATRVLLRPAVPGTGIIAGKTVRAILEVLGVKDVISKTLGSTNAVNVVKATMDGLTRLQLPEEVAEIRGKTVGEIFIAKKIRRTGKIEEEAVEGAEAGSGDQAADAQRKRDGRGGSPGGPRPNRPRPSSGHAGDSRRPSDRDRKFDRDRRPRPDRRPDRRDEAASQTPAASPAPAAPPAPTASPAPAAPQDVAPPEAPSAS